MYQLRPSLRLTLMAALVLFTMGCAATASAGSVPGIFLFIAALSVGGLGCFISGDEETPQTLNNLTEPRDMSGSDMASDLADEPDAGRWESCCNDGKISMCFCPEGVACNYGWYTTCAPGAGVQCAFNEEQCGPVDVDMAPDADMASDADMGGSWEPCCNNGQISSCFCPEGAACNYGWFTSCDPAQQPAVACALFEEECGYASPDMGVDPDQGVPDMPEDMGKGQWEPCCQNGQISSCFCPEGVACNYGWFTTCDPAQQPAVACALFEEQCGYAGADMGTPDMGAPDMGAPDMGGSWSPCCQGGQISSCFCPEGAVCNYGLVACDPATSGVACVLPRESCPVTM